MNIASTPSEKENLDAIIYMLSNTDEIYNKQLPEKISRHNALIILQTINKEAYQAFPC